MSTHHIPLDGLAASLADCNCRIASRLGMTVRTYRALTLVTRLAGLALAFYAISEGADAEFGLAVGAGMILGPDVLEAILLDEAGADAESEE